ncbi:MAG TPA: amino acid ABC transporter permease [Flexilinea sp.]|nr:amino acid ABC transporter permease [Flexilinea sp.]
MSLGLMLNKLSEGMATSVLIFVLTLLFSLPLGLLVALMRMSRHKVLQNLMRIYISVMRGTPLMLQLLVVYFGPYYIFGIKLSPNYRFWAVIIAFVINYAAYFAEIYRGGIASVPSGQYEAAKVLGYSSSQTFLKIIFPQMIKRIIPPITNEVITLIKDTSLAFAVAVTEMFTVAKALASAEKTMTAYVFAGVFYYVFNLIVAFVMENIEKRLNYYRL